MPDNIGLLYHRHLAMFGPREMLLSSQEPVVRQFLNAQRDGPIGMAEEKDADELAQERDAELPPLPPIPLQLEPSDGAVRLTQRPPGEWCRAHGVTPPPGSFGGAAPDGGRLGRGGGLVSNPAAATLRSTGSLFALFLDVVRALPRRPFQTGSSSSRPGSSPASRSCRRPWWPSRSARSSPCSSAT